MTPVLMSVTVVLHGHRLIGQHSIQLVLKRWAANVRVLHRCIKSISTAGRRESESDVVSIGDHIIREIINRIFNSFNLCGHGT